MGVLSGHTGANFTTRVRRFVAPEPRIAHQQDCRARGAPLVDFGIGLIPRRPSAVLI
jgi:hypothetical protein